MTEGNLSKIFLASILLIGFVFVAVGQEEPKETLLDEFGNIECEDLLARADNLGHELKSNPTLYGIIVVSGPQENDDEAIRLARFIHRAIVSRWGLQLRFRIVRITGPGELRLQFWLVRRESEFPHARGDLLASVPFTVNQRFYFGTESVDPCSRHISGGFALMLKSDPTYTGQLVVFNVPRSKRAETAAEWLKHFRLEHGIDRSRLRVFFKTDNSEAFIAYNYAEFWIVPVRPN